MHHSPVPRDEQTVRPALEAALAHAARRARYADALCERVYKVEVNRLASGQVLIKPGAQHGAVQVRLVGEGGRHIGIKCGTLEPGRLVEAVDRAAAALAGEPEDPGFGLADIPNPGRERYGLAPAPDLRDVDPTPALVALVRAVEALAEARAEAAGGGVRVAPEVWAWAQVEEKWVADTAGVFKSQVMPVAFLQVVFRATRGERAARTRVRFGEIAGLSHFVGDDGALAPAVRAELERECDRAVELLDARVLTAEELARVTHFVLHKSAMVFIHEGLGHPIEADIARANGSAIIDPTGRPRVEPLGSPVVRIIDGPGVGPRGEPAPDRGFGTEFIDDEGVEVQTTTLVDGGRIVGMMHNRETAHRFGVRPTGSGFSEMGDRRIVRMRNTVLCPEPGPHWVDDLAHLVQNVPFGVVLHGSVGGAVARDGMSSSTQYGLLVRDGRVTGELIAPGNFTALTAGCLLTVQGYAGAVESCGVGFCGKSGQTRRVTEGGPEYVKLGASPHVQLSFEG